eukprot:6083679-Pleurochrysis_carterae.AAC.1
MSISTDTNSPWQGSGRRRGGWAHLQGGSGRGSSAGSGSHREDRYPRARGAEPERAASTHAMRLQYGKLCM